ncbi:MAG: hypothetical protein AAF619_05830 [Pseudomonadota bacterium]
MTQSKRHVIAALAVATMLAGSLTFAGAKTEQDATSPADFTGYIVESNADDKRDFAMFE